MTEEVKITEANKEPQEKVEVEKDIKKKTKVVKDKKKKRIKHKVATGIVFVQSTYNNTIVNITDSKGNALAWSSSGAVGFKGAKKSTPYAATIVVNDVMEKIKDVGLSQIDIIVKGVGGGKESAIRALATYNLEVKSIKDVTPIPHNGCRPPKVRRV
ncbi:MAG: 30S ribosomal protein S11 [bacterium]